MERPRHCNNPLCVKTNGCALVQLVERQLAVTQDKVGGLLNEDGELAPQTTRMISGQEEFLRQLQPNPNAPLDCVYSDEERLLAFTRGAQFKTMLRDNDS